MQFRLLLTIVSGNEVVGYQFEGFKGEIEKNMKIGMIVRAFLASICVLFLALALPASAYAGLRPVGWCNS